jgi:hypothetical protein
METDMTSAARQTFLNQMNEIISAAQAAHSEANIDNLAMLLSDIESALNKADGVLSEMYDEAA